MMENKKDDKLMKLPRLGRWLSWVDSLGPPIKFLLDLFWSVLFCFVLI